MAEEEKVVAELALPPYLYQYLHRNLDIATSGMYPHSLDLSLRLARWLRMRVRITPEALVDPMKLRGPIPLTIDVPEYRSVPHPVRRSIIGHVQQMLFLEAVDPETRPCREQAQLNLSMVLADYGMDEAKLPINKLVDELMRFCALPATQREPPFRHFAPNTRLLRLENRTPLRGGLGTVCPDAGVQLYLVRCLNPAKAHTTPYGTALAEEMARVLDLAVVIAPPSKLDKRNLLRLEVAMPFGYQITGEAHTALVRCAEEQFSAEFFETVHYWTRFGKSRVYGMNRHRERYGITEEEIPLTTSQRAFSRYMRYNNMNSPPGRPWGSTTTKEV